MKYVVVDLTKSIPAGDLDVYADAQQRQLREDYADAFDGDGDFDLVRVATIDNPPDDLEFQLRLAPLAPDEGALGVHDLGFATCYLDLAVKYGCPWQSIMSHECLEARRDPRLHACVELDDGTIWDCEICDRVEADSYDIDGVPMSNFNTPECFEPPPNALPGAIRYDHMGLSRYPNEVRPGGYAQRYDSQTGWQQVGEMRGYRAELAKRGLSRGARRKARRP